MFIVIKAIKYTDGKQKEVLLGDFTFKYVEKDAVEAIGTEPATEADVWLTATCPLAVLQVHSMFGITTLSLADKKTILSYMYNFLESAQFSAGEQYLDLLEVFNNAKATITAV